MQALTVLVFTRQRAIFFLYVHGCTANLNAWPRKEGGLLNHYVSDHYCKQSK